MMNYADNIRLRKEKYFRTVNPDRHRIQLLIIGYRFSLALSTSLLITALFSLNGLDQFFIRNFGVKETGKILLHAILVTDP